MKYIQWMLVILGALLSCQSKIPTEARAEFFLIHIFRFKYKKAFHFCEIFYAKSMLKRIEATRSLLFIEEKIKQDL